MSLLCNVQTFGEISSLEVVWEQNEIPIIFITYDGKSVSEICPSTVWIQDGHFQISLWRKETQRLTSKDSVCVCVCEGEVDID